MELLSLNSPFAVTRLPSSRRAATEKSSSSIGQALTSPTANTKKCPLARNADSIDLRLRPLVSVQAAADSSSNTIDAIKQEMSSKDNCLVFVAGATGRVGSRTVRELLKLGFRVRAGVRSTKRAEALVQSVQQMKLDGVSGTSETQPVEKLEIVECDLEEESSIRPAIGSASIIICCIGASEKEVFDVTGPYRIDYKATTNLIEAATVAEVDHFILLTSLGTNKIGFPAAILNLFWGVLYWKRKAEEALISSGLPYTIVRPGGMERPTDSYKETHNIVLASEDTYFGGQVSNLQVAELMACMAKNRRLSFCKVVEVIAETTAPLTPMEELLAKIPSKRELPPEPTPDPASLIDPEPTSSAVEKEPGDGEVPQIKPLSPFAMYDDLKPPTSPTPTPSTTPLVQAEVEPSAEDEPATTTTITTTSTPKSMHLSPYMAYDDLKPPTSPSPTTPSISQSLGTGEGNDAEGTRTSRVIDNGLPQNSSHRSPFNVYEDLKPPTSPSPSVPSFISASAGPDNSTPKDSDDGKHLKGQNSRPLSPYTMYDDLKPPSSPLPSVPKY